MSELKKEWFEPGPDYKSPFGREMRRSYHIDYDLYESISAAFRALLAGEDVGRTADAKDAEIARLTAERDEARRVMIEAKAQRDKFWSQPDAAMVDERTGKADRREKNLFGVHGRPGKSDRRRVTPSTRADRGAS